MGLNSYYYDGLQPKMRAGIINEHECNKSIVLLKFAGIVLRLLNTGIVFWICESGRFFFRKSSL